MTTQPPDTRGARTLSVPRRARHGDAYRGSVPAASVELGVPGLLATKGVPALICLPWNQAEHLALLLAGQFAEQSRPEVAANRGPDRSAGSTRRRLSNYMIHVIGPRHLAVSRQPGPHPQAGRTASPANPSPPFLPVRGGPEPRYHRPITAQHLCAAAHVMLLHTHPARLSDYPPLRFMAAIASFAAKWSRP
jgi:hypothetical protein